MKISKTLLTLTMLGVALSCQADIKADRETVNTACAQDAKTANCPDAKMGTGLMKCFHDYKAANKDFKQSDVCRSALKTFNADKKEKSKSQTTTSPTAKQ